MSNLMYRLTLLMLIFVFVFLFRNESSLLEKFANYLSLIILILGLIVIYIWFNGDLSRYLNQSLKLVYYFWIVITGWFFLVPVIFYGVGFNSELLYQGIYHDYRYLLFSFLPFMFVGKSVPNYFQNIFERVGTVALLSGIVAIFLVDKSFSSVSYREGTWTVSYYLWWVVLCVYPYFFLKNNFLKKDYKGLALISIHLVLSLFFLKRSGFVNAILLISSTALFSEKSSRSLKIISYTGVLIVIGITIFGDYLDLLLMRFSSDAEDLGQFNRNLEVDEFLEQNTMTQLLTGYGANNYLKMNYVGIEDNAVNSLHIGFYNLIYKGGVLYVLFSVFLGFQILSLKKYIKFNPEIKIGFIIGVVYLISFSFENGWSYVPIHFFSLLAIYRAIHLKDEVKIAFNKREEIQLKS